MKIKYLDSGDSIFPVVNWHACSLQSSLLKPIAIARKNMPSSNKINILTIFLYVFLCINSLAEEVVYVGILEPTETETIKSKNNALLVKNVDEGAFVKAGDILYELDAIGYEERKIQIESELRKLEAEQNINKLAFEKRLIDAKQRVLSLKVNYEIAALNYKELLNGANEADIKVSEEKVKLAKLILENSKLELELIKKLVENGYVSKEEFNTLTFKIKSEEEELRLLILEKEYVKAGPTSIQIEEAKIINDIRKKQLDNAVNQMSSLEKSYGELLQFQSKELKKKKKKVDEANQDIANCIVRAPIDGTVFYERFPWGEKIPIGKFVWEGLNVRSISNLSNMSVKIKIPVENISEYTLNQKAKIEIFSTGEITSGEILKIFQIQEDEFFDAHNKTKQVLGSSNKKVFVVKIKMLDGIENLKPGMTAKVIFEMSNKNEKK